MDNPTIRVKKHSGELLPFQGESLKTSLLKSGASTSEVQQVYQQICANIYDGISTRELYKQAFQLLKNQRNSYAARYSLKKALRDLGPEGFYFEKWVARIFSEGGFNAINGQIIQGHAVTHEIDVIAQNDQEMIAAECKFRNDIDAKIGVTTPMYFLSRFTDISTLNYTYFGKSKAFTQGWLVTNAYFSKDAIAFGAFYKLHLLSWDYPQQSSIKRRVDKGYLYPLTCLTTLTKSEKDILLKKDIILVKELVLQPAVLQHIACSNQKKNRILTEAKELVKLHQEAQ